MSSGQEGEQEGVGEEKSIDMEFTKEEREEAGKLLVKVFSCHKCAKRIRRRMLAVKQRAVKVRVMSSLVTFIICNQFTKLSIVGKEGEGGCSSEKER